MSSAQTRKRQAAGVSGPVHVQGREKQGKMGIARRFMLRVGVHQDSVLSPLLFINVRDSIQGVLHRPSMGTAVRR